MSIILVHRLINELCKERKALASAHVLASYLSNIRERIQDELSDQECGPYEFKDTLYWDQVEAMGAAEHKYLTEAIRKGNNNPAGIKILPEDHEDYDLVSDLHASGLITWFINTCHITQNDIDVLNNRSCTTPRSNGPFVYVPSWDADEEGGESELTKKLRTGGASEFLLHIFKLAEEQDVSYIDFDDLGPILDTLPTPGYQDE